MGTYEAASALAVYRSRKAVALLFIGFSSGLPLLLTSRTLQAWMVTEGVALSTIGFFSLVGLPYSWKFVWAPLLDRYMPPLLGRRRGWLLLTQAGLVLAIGAMGFQDPEGALWWLAACATAVAFLSASQDVVADAYRTDVLAPRERGAGAAMFILGYRSALLVAGALALVLADWLPWSTVYLLLSALMLGGIAATLAAPEPERPAAPPQSLGEAVRLPFIEFFSREGAGWALGVLAFIVLYKLGDSLALIMVTPFLLATGYSQTDIGVVQGGLGLGASIFGALAGGAVLSRIGVAFMMSLCSPGFSATQFALLSSLAAVSRDVLVAPSGGLVEAVGWPAFFLITTVAAVPGLLLLSRFASGRGLPVPPSLAVENTPQTSIR